MPITEALKKLIKTITGKNAVGETIEELVQNLEENYPEGNVSGGADIVLRSYYHGNNWEAEPFSLSDIREKLMNKERINVRAIDMASPETMGFYIPTTINASSTDVAVGLLDPYHLERVELIVSEDGTVIDTSDEEPN